MHFELEKIFPINVLGSIDAIQNRQADLAIGVCFCMLNVKTFADFFGHIVSPAGPISGWKQFATKHRGKRRCRKY